MNKQRPRLQKLSPREQARLSEARRMFDAGRLPAADGLCGELIEAKPRASEPYLLKSWINVQSGHFFAAQIAVEAAVRLLPSDPGVLAWAAEVCSDAADLRAAEHYRARAMALTSRDISVARSLAASLTNQERYAEALPFYQRLLQREPDNTQARINVAYAARYVGDFSLAESELSAVLEREPNYYQAYFALAQLRQASAASHHIDGFERALAAGKGNPDAELFLSYALGKEYEDLGDYGAAFAYYARGARCQWQRRAHPSAETAVAKRAATLFREPPVTPGGERGAGLVFIVGLPRTGSTLLDRMLGAHSQVDNGGELQVLPAVAHRQLNLLQPGVMAPELLDSLPRLNLERLGDDYLACLPNPLGTDRFYTDKNPNNFLYAGLIARALPAAKVVNIYRNPMDACFSNFKQLFAGGAYIHSYDLEAMAAHYAAYDALRKVWRETLGPQYIEVRYEELVADSEGQLQRLAQACGLAWQPAMLDFNQRHSSVGTASFAQVRQPVYSTSVEKWRHFEVELQPLLEALGERGIDVTAPAVPAP